MTRPTVEWQYAGNIICYIDSGKLIAEVKSGGMSHTVFWSQRGDSTLLNLEPLHFPHECGSRLLHMLSFSRQGAWRGHYEGFFLLILETLSCISSK